MKGRIELMIIRQGNT